MLTFEIVKTTQSVVEISLKKLNEHRFQEGPKNCKYWCKSFSSIDRFCKLITWDFLRYKWNILPLELVLFPQYWGIIDLQEALIFKVSCVLSRNQTRNTQWGFSFCLYAAKNEQKHTTSHILFSQSYILRQSAVPHHFPLSWTSIWDELIEPSNGIGSSSRRCER